MTEKQDIHLTYEEANRYVLAKELTDNRTLCYEALHSLLREKVNSSKHYSIVMLWEFKHIIDMLIHEHEYLPDNINTTESLWTEAL